MFRIINIRNSSDLNSLPSKSAGMQIHRRAFSPSPSFSLAPVLFFDTFRIDGDCSNSWTGPLGDPSSAQPHPTAFFLECYSREKLRSSTWAGWLALCFHFLIPSSFWGIRHSRGSCLSGLISLPSFVFSVRAGNESHDDF